MQVKEIEVKYGVTKNLGNYESLRMDYGARVQLEDGEKPADVIDKTREYLKEKMKADIGM
jgi:hypothetical protein